MHSHTPNIYGISIVQDIIADTEAVAIFLDIGLFCEFFTGHDHILNYHDDDMR